MNTKKFQIQKLNQKLDNLIDQKRVLKDRQLCCINVTSLIDETRNKILNLKK